MAVRRVAYKASTVTLSSPPGHLDGSVNGLITELRPALMAKTQTRHTCRMHRGAKLLRATITQAFQPPIPSSRRSAGIRRNPDAQNSRLKILKQLKKSKDLSSVRHVKRARMHTAAAAGTSSHGQNAQAIFASSMTKLRAVFRNLNHQKSRD